MMLSEHFSFAELTSSDYAIRHGLNNTPTDHDVLENLHTLANSLERVRALLGKPIIISSGYRSPKVNSSVGGSSTSYHQKGLAADFHVPGMTPREVCQKLAEMSHEIGFRTCIYEGTWTHLDFPDVDESPAGRVLTAIFKNGKATYVQGVA